MKIKTVLWGLATAALLVSCSGAKLSVANEQYARGEFYDAAQTYRKVYSKTNPRKERKPVSYTHLTLPTNSRV